MRRLLALLLLFLSFSNALRIGEPVDFQVSACPSVIGCECVGDDPTVVACHGIRSSVVDELAVQFPRLRSLAITGWLDYHLPLEPFQQLRELKELRVEDAWVETISANRTELSVLEVLSLSGNRISNWSHVCDALAASPVLKELLLVKNRLTHMEECVGEGVADKLQKLDMHENGLASVAGWPSPTLSWLSLARNSLRSLPAPPRHIQWCDLSHNPLVDLKMDEMNGLKVLNLSSTLLESLPNIRASKLEELRMEECSRLTVLDVSRWRVPSLRTLSLSGASQLVSAFGRLPSSIRDVAIQHSQIRTFPEEFFSGSLVSLDLSHAAGSQWDCDECVVRWSTPVASLLNGTVCPAVAPAPLDNCKLGISSQQPEMFRSRHGGDIVMPCAVYGSPAPKVSWWRVRPKLLIGSFDPATSTVTLLANNTRYAIGGGGVLKISSAAPDVVERYICVAENAEGKVWRQLHFRLDYRFWYSLDIFESVFWGSCFTAIVVCSFSFLLNITWIICRKSILWWINRAERLSRVQKMVEAMEKYRSRQLEGLQERYTRRVQHVRDNYHSQVETLRASYSAQAEKFRGYRTAQMDAMRENLDHMRDNYNQQMGKVRDYGSRRAEQLWESYERQVNRVRAFSLQHRLKLMRQYKVKQRYLNKLLETFQDVHSPEEMRRHEEQVRAVLDLPAEQSLPGEGQLSRASSFYSLPEYVMDENGQLRPSSLIGGAEVRFTREPLVRRSPASPSPDTPSTSKQ